MQRPARTQRVLSASRHPPAPSGVTRRGVFSPVLSTLMVWTPSSLLLPLGPCGDPDPPLSYPSHPPLPPSPPLIGDTVSEPAAVASAVETGQMSSAETGQMSAVGTGQMSAAEAGQMSAAETGQMSAVETRQMYSIKTGQRPVAIVDICLVSTCTSKDRKAH